MTEIQMDNEDLSEQEQNVHTYVLEIKTLLEKQNVVIPSHCDPFIARCLRVKNYDVEKAAQLVKNFRVMMGMEAMQDLYAMFKPSELKDVYFKGTITPLLMRDSLGRLIVLARAASWNPDTFNFDKILAAFIVLVNYAIAKSKENQSSGVVFVLDFTGWNIKQIRTVKLGRLRLVAKFMQSSSPMKIKGIHIIHHPKVATVLFLLIKPFLKAKLASRIHFHGDEESMQRFVGPQLLPDILAGIITRDSSIIDEELLLDVIQQDEYCEEMVKSGYPSY